MSEKKNGDGPSLWDLDVNNITDNHFWCWWWGLFYIDDRENNERPRQLMILWSTKCTDFIKVMNKEWSPEKISRWEENRLEFDGLVAAWWYDGEDMEHPLLLEEANISVEKDGVEGSVKTDLEDREYSISGDPDKYTVKIIDQDNDFIFEMTPLNDYLSKHRYKENSSINNNGYNIMKIYGMNLDGRIDGEEVEGTAYLQRVRVEMPMIPWYWGMAHCEDGSFLQYFNPFIGPQIFRTKENQRSLLDWGDISLKKSVMFYHRGTDKEYKFKKGSVDIQKELDNDLPTFYVSGEDDGNKISIRLRAYSRAFWRFQQKRRFGMKQMLYYNEYPAEVVDFSFESAEDSLKLEKEDIGRMYGNFEHTWGKLF